jgi:predicted nucleic acid-binding protein
VQNSVRQAARVVDASIVAAVLFSEANADAAAKRLSSYKLVAPTLFDYELTSICLKKLKSYPEQRDAILKAYSDLSEIDIERREVEYGALSDVAEPFGLTVYDAAYLWLANTLSVELLTLDKKLLAAARQHRRVD